MASPKCPTCGAPGVAKGPGNGMYEPWKCANGHDFTVRVGALSPPTNHFPFPIRLPLPIDTLVCDVAADKGFTVLRETRNGNIEIGTGKLGDVDGKHSVIENHGLAENVAFVVMLAVRQYLHEE